MKEFLIKNKVLCISSLSAILLVLQQAFLAASINYVTLAYAVAVALIGVIANSWKGAGITLTGIIGTVCYAFMTSYNGGAFTWKEFGVTAATALVSALISSLNAYNTNPVVAVTATPTAEVNTTTTTTQTTLSV